MKILVFSDSHLSLPFEEKKFKFLKDIISEADQVIINGDFWEGYRITFNQFINSPWKYLFPHLKSKRAIYLFGNHDRKTFSDKKTSLFSQIQSHQYRMKLNGNILQFEHGHRLFPSIDETHPNLFKIIKKVQIMPVLHKMLVRKFGSKFFRKLFRPQNKIIKKKIKLELRDSEILICGHTHSAEFDMQNRFINTGFVRDGLAQYLVIRGEKITPKEEWYD